MILPSSTAKNAGGRTLFYYINSVQNDSRYKVNLIAKVLDGESFNKDELPNIRFYPIYNKKLSIKSPINALKDINSKLNPFSRYGNVLRWNVYEQLIDILKEVKEKPDVIVLAFTEIVLLASIIRKMFPNARILASEYDVTYLGFKRRILNEKNLIKKGIKFVKYIVRKKNELESLALCDSVMPQNFKDKELLVSDGIDEKKFYILTPYFQKIECDRQTDHKTILFYGAMGRKENSDAAIWFIENVFHKLKKYNLDFIVLGSNPPKRLKNFNSDHIVITGYVDDVTPYFERCLCMVAPLLEGAGIKVKILEAFTSGIPVLTNNIGIEGINALDGEDYLHCESIDDYINSILGLLSGEIDVKKLESNSKKLMLEQYNLEESINSYKHNLTLL